MSTNRYSLLMPAPEFFVKSLFLKIKVAYTFGYICLCVWDMQRYVRNNSMSQSNFFKCVKYHPDESQILTCGTDRKVNDHPHIWKDPKLV